MDCMPDVFATLVSNPKLEEAILAEKEVPTERMTEDIKDFMKEEVRKETLYQI